MDCNKAKEYINMYVDDMLTDAEEQQLMQHVSSCAHCKKEIDDAIALKRSLSGLGDIAPPAGLAASAIKKAKKSRVPTFAFISAGVAAAVIAVVVIATSVLPGGGGLMNAQRAEEEIAFTESADSAEMSKANDADMMMEATSADTDEAEAPMADEAGGAQRADEETMPMDVGAAADDGEMEADDAAESVSLDFCMISVAPDNADFGQAVYTFVTEARIETQHIEFDGGSVMSFIVDEEHFAAFESMLLEEGIGFEGTLYPGCLVEITFYE